MSIRRLFLLPLLGALAGVLPTGCAATQPQQPPSAVLVRFERTVCFGPCPADVLTIFQNGQMQYEGHQNAPRTGVYTSRLSARERQALTQAFDEARFFALAPAYKSGAPDLPTYYLCYAAGGRQHQVVDQVNAPARLKKLEAHLKQLIDDSPRWHRP